MRDFRLPPRCEWDMRSFVTGRLSGNVDKILPFYAAWISKGEQISGTVPICSSSPLWSYHGPGVSRRPLTAETPVKSQDSLCGVCCGWGGTVTGLPLSTSALSYRFYLTNVLHSLIHPSPKLSNLSSWQRRSRLNHHYENRKSHRSMRTALFWVITQRVVAISYRRFGKHLSLLQGSKILFFWLLNPWRWDW
jgi:hypothetical protein